MAPKRSVRIPTKSASNGENYEALTLNDVLCPVCRYILVEPVTLPCSHNFCGTCFRGTLENANLTCPLCRIRFGSWHRIAKKDNKITNNQLWQVVQRKFPNHVQNRLNGIDEVLEEVTPVRLTSEGEIRKEYEHQRKQAEIELQKEREAEEMASSMLIKMITEREKMEELAVQEKLKLDEQIAKKLALEETNAVNNATPPKKTRPLDKFLLNMSNSPKQQKSTSQTSTIEVLVTKCSKQKNLMNFVNETSDSNDSIENECRYFKPIDYRNIPPPQTSNLIRIPAKVEKPSLTKILPPSGIKLLNFNNISAFVSANVKENLKACPSSCETKKRKHSGEGNRSSNSNNTKTSKKLCLLEVERTFSNAFGNLPKSSKSNQSPPSPHKMTLRDRKHTSPTTSFLNFSDIELTFSKIKGHQIDASSGNSSSKSQDWKRQQEEADLEFAKKLQEEFNKERYLTRRSSNCRNNIRQPRQVTLTEILSTSKCK